MELAVLLVNELVVTQAFGKQVVPPAGGPERAAAIQAGLARAERPPSGSLTPEAADVLADVAADLRRVFGAGDGLHAAAESLNRLLVRHAAVPNLHGHAGGPLVLGFHRPEAMLPDAWAADAATALAMVIGVGQAARLRSCEANGCDLVFFDVTRNASRRFCGLTCQNRAKAGAYRARRQSSGDGQRR